MSKASHTAALPAETLTSSAVPATGSWLLLVLLIGLTALGETSTQLLLPILPEAAKALHTSPGGMQASLTLFFVATLGLVSLLAPSVAAVIAPQLLVTLGAGLVLPSAVAGAVLPFGERAGLAAGLLGFAQMGIAVAFGFGLSLIQNGTSGPMLLIQLLAALSAFGLFCLLNPRPVSQA